MFQLSGVGSCNKELTYSLSLVWPDRFFPFMCGGGGTKGLVYSYYRYMTYAENYQILVIFNCC